MTAPTTTDQQPATRLALTEPPETVAYRAAAGAIYPGPSVLELWHHGEDAAHQDARYTVQLRHPAGTGHAMTAEQARELHAWLGATLGL